MFRSPVAPGLTMGLFNLCDAEAFLTLVNENRAHLRPWFGWVETFSTMDDSVRFLQGAMAQYAQGAGLKIGLWQHDVLVGSLSVQALDWMHRSATLGYWLAQSAQGQGIIHQSLGALMQGLAQHYGMVRFEARCMETNLQSQRVLERLGFTREALLHESLWMDGRGHSEILYSKQADACFSGPV